MPVWHNPCIEDLIEDIYKMSIVAQVMLSIFFDFRHER